MGEYIYKVTSRKVRIEGGLEANIAVFAYKPFMSILGDGPSNGLMHVRSGAGACDRAAAAGKRTGWVVMGYENDDGTMSVNPIAYEIGAALGSFSDGWLDLCVSKGWLPARDVISSSKVRIAA